MSVLGFVKAQRVPLPLNGDDEIFQKELQAVRGKLAAQRSQANRIYRAGQQPTWLPDGSDSGNTTAATSTAATPAASSLAHALQRVKVDLHQAAGTGSEVSRARRVTEASVIQAAASGGSRRPFVATLVAHTAAHDPDGVDADGDAHMGEGDEEEEEEQGGRHRDGARRRPVEATIIVAAPAAAASSSTISSSFAIDTSQLEVPEPAEDEDEEERATADRRRRARLNAAAREEEELARQAEEAKKKELEEEAEEEEDEEEDESEYESDSDDERRRMMLKPIFRSKAQRDTLADRERMEAEEQKLEDDRIARKGARKKESKLLVLAELQREVAQEHARAAAAGIDSDGEPLDEPLDEEFELDLWKLRELRRLKRDRDERKVYEAELATTERRRGMTDDEIRADNERLGLERQAVGEKSDDPSSFRFMQRYYHKGGFYQDDDSLKENASKDLAARDFHQPTGADRTVDRSSLPAVMQVKKFAMKGRTKYTHLVDQDTTRRDENPWSRRNTLVDTRGPTGGGDVISGQRKKHKPQD